MIDSDAVWAVAVFVRVELEAMARRAWHRIACAWMQCDEAPVVEGLL